MKQTANFDNVLNEVQGSVKSFMENIFFFTTIVKVNSLYFLIL